MAERAEPDVRREPLVLALSEDRDVVRARQAVRECAVLLGFDLMSQTKLITATSELGRNTVIHGHGGNLTITTVRQGGPATSERVGLRLVFADDGPGIPDLASAMTSGWTSGNGLGLGLPGSKRLVHEFDVDSRSGAGTTVTIVMWRRS